jgi:hypothetical protein
MSSFGLLRSSGVLARAMMATSLSLPLGQEWQPRGATSGDAKQKQHVEKTPLTHFREGWDGSTEPARSFGTLGSFLKRGLLP